MAHLAAPRIGWENEHLATFLLSRISFVANPLTIADDVGSDFFCTLFESRIENNAEQLFPRNSFAIQIKSKEETILATNQIEYLTKLELPFFVGVIDRENLRLNIYSGEYVPILFTEHGIPQKELKLSPVRNVEIEIKNYCQITKDESLHVLTAFLRMPFVIEISASDKRDTVFAKARQVSDLCSRMHQNISARVSQEYIFGLSEPGSALIMAGPGSATTFRRNFYFRLAEAFYNLEWIMKSPQHNLRLDEFRVYEQCYVGLNEAGIEITDLLRGIYTRLKSQLTQ
ncbi:MAG: hypothetical protein ACT4O4_02580 [Nitrospiraceae bacterium]